MADDQKMSWLAVIREIGAILIAVIVMVLFVILLTQAMQSLPSNTARKDDLGPIKELLAIVNPTIGLIIGYYFSRVTTEARAEKAEASAATAQQTVVEVQKANAGAESQIRDKNAALKSLADAAEKVAPKTDVDRVSALSQDDRIALRAAIERARQSL